MDDIFESCPVCGEPGKRIRPETLKNMLKAEKVPGVLDSYSLCLSKECNVTYFGRHIFYKDDLKVKIWFKEADWDVPICYCKGVSEKEIISHVAIEGCCKNLKDIQGHTGANTGKECLFKNPAGT